MSTRRWKFFRKMDKTITVSMALSAAFTLVITVSMVFAQDNGMSQAMQDKWIIDNAIKAQENATSINELRTKVNDMQLAMKTMDIEHRLTRLETAQDRNTTLLMSIAAGVALMLIQALLHAFVRFKRKTDIMDAESEAQAD